MKRTRKWAFVAQEAQRLASLGVHPQAIADRLGVNRSTITRWTQQGKLAWSTPAPPGGPARSGQAPADWATAMRTGYDLDATDEQLVALAEQALTLATDATAAPPLRLQAMGRYQTLVRQLALVARHAEPQTAAPPARTRHPVVQRSGGDPRRLLQTVQ